MAKDLRYYLKFDSNGRKVMQELGVSSGQLDKALEGVGKRSKAATQSLVGMAAANVVFDGLANALGSLCGVMGDLTAATAVQAEAETKLATVMQTRMNATGAQIQGIKDLCSAQQELGVIGDEVQLAGAQQLATFLSMQSTLYSLIPAMNDLIAQQKGYSATGADAVSVANLMGKAMQGQVSALRRVGITFTEAQEAALKNGDEMERAAMLAEIITANVGNMNAALAQTDAGKQQQLANTLGDIKEQLGGMVQGAMPFLTMGNAAVLAATNVLKVANGVKAATAAIKSLNAVQAVQNGLMTAYNTIGASVGANLVRMGAGAGAARVAVLGLNAALSVGMVGALALAVTGIVSLVTHMNQAKTAANDLKQAAHDATMARYSGPRQETGDPDADYRAAVEAQNALKVKYKKIAGQRYSKERRRDSNKRLLPSDYEVAERTLQDLQSQIDAEQARIDKYRAQIKERDQQEADAARQRTAEAKRQQAEAKRQQAEIKAAAVDPWADRFKSIGEIRAAVAQLSDDINNVDLTAATKVQERIDYLNKLIQKAKEGHKWTFSAFRYIAPEDTPQASFRTHAAEKPGADAMTLKPVSVPALPRPDSLKEYQEAVGQIGKAWGGVQGIAGGISSITAALDENASAWQRLRGIIGGTLQIMQAVGTIMQVINPLVKANTALEQTNTATKQVQTGATMEQANANVMEAASGTMAANAKIPIAGIAIGAAAVAALLALMTSIPKFAQGGIAYGPTVGVFGEYPGASNNPEVVAPLNKLQSLLGASQPQINVEAKVTSRQLAILVNTRHRYTSRI